MSANGRKLRVSVDPTVEVKALRIGQEVILNEAYNIVDTRAYDPSRARWSPSRRSSRTIA